MAVKPVEYIKDSSTAGFAVAGDEKTITKTNANTIQKDVNQGNTEDLDNAQVKILNTWVNPDDIIYTADEQQNVGKNRIDTEGVEKTSDGEKSASVAGTAAVAGGFLFAYPIVYMIDSFIKIPVTLGHLIAAGIMLASAAAVLPVVNAFDPQYSERVSQEDSASDNNSIIQQYYDTMSSDMDSMLADTENYQGLIATKTETDMTRTIEIGALEAEKNVYLSRGDTARAEEIQKKIDEMTEGAKEDPLGEEIKALQEGMEGYYSHNNEALGVADAGNTVAEFLNQGTNMGIYGTINTLMLTLASAKAIICGAKAIGTIKWPWDAPIAFLASAIDITVAALFIAATAKMAAKTKKEFDCADAGEEMHEYLNDLNENIEGQGGIAENTATAYTEGDKEYAETMQKTQEAVDKALADQNTEPNPKKEKPNEPGNPTNPNDPPGDNPPPEK